MTGDYVCSACGAAFQNHGDRGDHYVSCESRGDARPQMAAAEADRAALEAVIRANPWWVFGRQRRRTRKALAEARDAYLRLGGPDDLTDETLKFAEEEALARYGVDLSRFRAQIPRRR